MISASANITNMLDSSVRSIAAKVEFYTDSTLAYTFNSTDKLVDFSIERVAEEGKFFGYGYCQKITIKLIDVNREVNITTAHSIKVSIGIENEYVQPFPTFYVQQVRRDENTNQLTIYGYDLIYPASTHTVAELTLTTPYTIEDFADACRTLLNMASLSIQRVGETETCFDTEYIEGANFEGTESIREALNDVAEATQTIYFVNNADQLVFKRLDKNAAPDLTISKADYFTLENRDSRRLQTIASVTELGDNISASTTLTGSTQYCRDNAFWDLRLDTGTLVQNAVNAVGDTSINQFTCEWRGNFLLEIGDKLGLITKDNTTAISYLLDDTITYDGGLSETTQWDYNDNDTETETNSASLGEVLNQTYARVDKAAQTVEIVASQVEGMNENIAQLQMDTESITASVQQVQENTQATIDGIQQDVDNLTQRVEASVTADEVQLQIQQEMQNGINKVTTSTGFTFDETGLTIEKSGSEIKTQITEDGMTVTRNDEEVLKANNAGVDAVNLHATTYLIIGTNSRFEDYANGSRTGCFWIGN